MTNDTEPPIDVQAVVEAADLYLADPTTRTHQIGLVTLDLAAVIATNEEVARLVADPQVERLEKRKAVVTAAEALSAGPTQVAQSSASWRSEPARATIRRSKASNSRSASRVRPAAQAASAARVQSRSRVKSACPGAVTTRARRAASASTTTRTV